VLVASEASILRTRERGLRVRVLANLGGLVAIAGLEHVEPDLLLGALLEVSERLPQRKPSLAERMRARGAEARRRCKSLSAALPRTFGELS
jgi:hypothetical protein